MIHFYSLGVEAGFYSDVVECLPVDPANWGRFPTGAGKIFSLYDKGLIHMCLTHISRIYFPTIINWTSPFLFEGL